jgi:TrmH family RNA methyltransferase
MKENIITSRTNPRLKQTAALHQRKNRDATGLIWVEGTKCVNALLGSAYSIQEIYVSTDAQTTVQTLAESARKKGHTITRVTPQCFKKCSVLRNPEGIGAVAARRVPGTLQDRIDTPAVVLWQLKEPGNLGSIIRTAVGLECRTILIAEPSVDTFHPMCIRGSAGALFNAFLYKASAEEMQAWLKERAPSVAGLSGDGLYTLEDGWQPCKEILVIGNEPHGLPEIIRQQFDTIRLPMAHNVESLNVTAAAAIAIYTLWHSHRSQEPS